MALTITLAITVAVFAAGYWSAVARIERLQNYRPDSRTVVILAAAGLTFAGLAIYLLSGPPLAIFFAQYLVLCVGQCAGYLFSSKGRQ